MILPTLYQLERVRFLQFPKLPLARQRDSLPHFASATAAAGVTTAVGAAAAELALLEGPFSLGPFLLLAALLLSFRLDGAAGEGDSDSPLFPFSVRVGRSPCEPDAWPFEEGAAGGAAAACPLTRSSPPGDPEWCPSFCGATGPPAID